MLEVFCLSHSHGMLHFRAFPNAIAQGDFLLLGGKWGAAKIYECSADPVQTKKRNHQFIQYVTVLVRKYSLRHCSNG